MKRQILYIGIGLVGIGLLGSGSLKAQSTLIGLGDLAGGTFFSAATGVSSDGSFVTGYSNATTGYVAFRWSDTLGIVALSGLSAVSFESYGTDISADGSTIVGYDRSLAGNEAFRWTTTGGRTGLGDLPGGLFDSNGTDISDDGSIIVGTSRSSIGDEGFRWTAGTGMVGLGIATSITNGISGDGSVMVGSVEFPGFGPQAFRWTAGTGVVGLGDFAGTLPGLYYSIGYDVSSDGTVVIGQGNHSASGSIEAFRWTSTTGMVGIGDLPGGSFYSQAYAVSGNGNAIVGTSSAGAGSEAFLWNPTVGMVKLYDALLDTGADLTGWSKLDIGLDISTEGNAIVGYGQHNGRTEAFIARNPNPGGWSVYSASITSAPEPTSCLFLAFGLSIGKFIRRKPCTQNV
jgi:probable HAF family extracellular repeat protein